MLLGVSVAGYLGASQVRAESPDASPTLVAVEMGNTGDDCPDAEALAAEVNRVTRSASVAPARPGEEPGIVVRLERDVVGLHARIEAASPIAGVREISDPGTSCLELGNALAVTIALLVDPTSAGRETAPPDAGGEEENAAAAAVGGDVATSSPAGATVKSGDSGSAAPVPPATPGAGRVHSGRIAPSRREQPSALGGPTVAFDAEGGAGVALGITFPATPAVQLGFGAHRGAWRGELGALWLPRQRRTVGAVPVELELWAGTLELCRQVWMAREEWPGGVLCLEGVGGVLEGRAKQVDDPSPAKLPWVGAGAGFGLRGRIWGPFAWYLHATALHPFYYQRLRVRGQDALVYDPTWVDGLIAAGFGLSSW